MAAFQRHNENKAFGHPRRGAVGKVILILVIVAIAAGGYLGLKGWLAGQPATMWGQAEAFAKAGDHEAARLTLESLLQKAPEHRDAHLALAEAQVELAKKDNPRVTYAGHPAALEHVQKAWELKKDDLETAELLLAADLRSNRLEEGLPVAEEILRQKPDHADALYLTARSELGKRNFSRVDALVDRLSALPGEPRPRTLALAATAAYVTENAEKYVAALETTLAVAGGADEKLDDTDLLALQGLLAASVEHAGHPTEANRRAAAALAVLERPVPFGREADAAFQALAVGGNLSQRLSAATGAVRDEMVALLERSLKLGGPALASVPPRPAAFSQAAIIAQALGRSEEAEATLLKGIAALTKESQVPVLAVLELRVVAAQQLAAQGRFRSAEEHVDELLKHKESAGWGHMLAGNIAMLEGRYDASLRHLADAQARLGQTLPVKFSLARTLMALKRWDRALTFLDTLHVDPKTLTPHERRWAEMNLADGKAVHLLQAQARLSMGDGRGAERHLAELQGSRFESAAIAMQVSWLWNKQKHAEAAELVQAARGRFPDDLQLARLHALLLARRNQPAAAERVLSSLAERHPESLPIQVAACQWIISQRRFDEALVRIAEIKQKFPEAPQLQLLEAQTLLRADRPEEALRIVEGLDQKALGNAREVLGVMAAMRLNELDEAAEGLEVLAGSERKSAATSLLAANLASARGDTEHSIDALQETMQYTNLRSMVGQFLYRAVLQLAQKEGPAAAADRLRELLEQYPGEASLMMAQVDLDWQQGRRASARNTLDRVIEANPGMVWPMFVKAKLLAIENRPDEAMPILDELLVSNRTHLEARLLFANLLMRDQPDNAVVLIEQGLQLTSDQPQLLLTKAAALAAANKLDEAIAVAEALEKSHPELPQTYQALAQFHLRGEQPDAAVNDVLRGIKQLPGNAGFVRAGIVMLCQLKKYEEADKAARLASSSGEVALAATEVFLQAGRLAEARAWAERALERTQADQREIARLLAGDIARAEALAAEKEAKDALLTEARGHYLAIADGESPLKIDGTIRLLRLQTFDTGETDAAFERAEKMREELDVATAPVPLIDTLIAVFRGAGRDESLRALVDAAAVKRPEQLHFLMAKAHLSTEQKDFQLAVEEFQTLAKDNPSLAGPSYALAWVWAQRSNPRLALQAIAEALRREPRFVQARQLAIEQHKKLGNPGEVIRHAEAILEQNPRDWNVQLARLEALRETVLEEEFQAAVKDLTDTLRGLVEAEGSEDTAAHLALARLHRLNDDSTQAEAALREALAFAPHDVAIVGELVELLIATERRGEAEQLARKVAEDPEAAELAVAFGRLFYKHGLYEAARVAAQRTLEDAGRGEELAARWLLGDVALAEGKSGGSRERFIEARDHYRWMLEAQPTHLVAGNNLAWVLVSHLDEPREALAVAEQVRAGSPVNALHPSFVDTLARAYRKSGRLAEAQSLLEDSLFVNPEQASLRLELAQVHIDKGNPSAARAQLQAALDLQLTEEQAQEVRRLLAELD
ncbi:MAG: tetratricopeptide repeat protein [Planctomycetaceae bacterium]